MTTPTAQAPDRAFYTSRGLTPVINVSGTMTALGASIAGKPVRDATAERLEGTSLAQAVAQQSPDLPA